jgi:hypothetical protein
MSALVSFNINTAAMGPKATRLIRPSPIDRLPVEIKRKILEYVATKLSPVTMSPGPEMIMCRGIFAVNHAWRLEAILAFLRCNEISVKIGDRLDSWLLSIPGGFENIRSVRFQHFGCYSKRRRKYEVGHIAFTKKCPGIREVQIRIDDRFLLSFSDSTSPEPRSLEWLIDNYPLEYVLELQSLRKFTLNLAIDQASYEDSGGKRFKDQLRILAEWYEGEFRKRKIPVLVVTVVTLYTHIILEPNWPGKPFLETTIRPRVLSMGYSLLRP